MKSDSVAVTRPTPDCVQVALAHPVLNQDLVSELAEALHEAESTDGTRIIILTADGADFCTGMPLVDGRTTDQIVEGLLAARLLLKSLAESPLITVALVNGRATGGGVALAAACDQVVAGPEASFRITELLVGVLPAILLPAVTRRTGQHRAMSLLLTAPLLDAEAAVAQGLADRVVLDPDKGLRALVRDLRRTDPGTVAALKRYSKTLGPQDDTPEVVEQAMREWLDDPNSRARVSLLADQGFLS